jgi:hypothetical protein
LPEDVCASPGTCHCRSSDSVPLKRGGETVSDTIGTASVCVFLSWPSTQCGRTAIPLRGENHKGREVRQEVKRGGAPRYKPRTIQGNEIMADQPSAGGSLLPSEGGLLLLSAEIKNKKASPAGRLLAFERFWIRLSFSPCMQCRQKSKEPRSGGRR